GSSPESSIHPFISLHGIIPWTSQWRQRRDPGWQYSEDVHRPPPDDEDAVMEESSPASMETPATDQARRDNVQKRLIMMRGQYKSAANRHMDLVMALYGSDGTVSQADVDASKTQLDMMKVAIVTVEEAYKNCQDSHAVDDTNEVKPTMETHKKETMA
ncbi:hypothetical protein BGZ70_006838, partial [Mortierella alpina]